MKRYLLLAAVPLAFSSCGNVESDKVQYNFDRAFPLETPVENALLTKWANKEVKDSLLIDDMEGKVAWKKNNGIATLEYTADRAIDGKQALRYHTSLRDTAHIMLPENRSPWGSFGGQQGGGASFGITFDEPQDWSAYNRVSIWVYIHPSANPNHHFFLEVINEGTDYNTVTPRKDTVVQDLEAGKWHNVVWEITNMERDKVKHFNIFQTLIGYDDVIGEEYVTYDFDRLQLQRVDADNYEGWAVPEAQFAFSHIGYRPQDVKQALTAAGTVKEFQLLDNQNMVVYTGVAEQIQHENGTFTQMDFSSFQTPGTYRLKYGSAVSKSFPIGEDVWLEPMFSGINFYFSQRCGYDVPGIHSVCHKDWQGYYGDEKKVINGGWHDAGDLSQGYYRTAIGAYALMRNLMVVQNNSALADLVAKLKDEALWGIKWLVKTRFADGHHISWARQRIYSDNEIGTIDDVVIKAQNVPWENFLGSAVLTMAEQFYPELDVKELKEMEHAALDNWEQAYKARGDWERSSYQEASWGAISSVLLYQKTKDEKYKQAALRFGKLLMECQEQVFQEGIPITGYFFSSSDRRRPIYNNHGAFNEAPMLALRTLCQAFPNEADWIEWYSSAAIYSDYFMKRGSEIAAPFHLVPNAVYRKADMLAHRNEYNRKYNMIQYNDGTQLNENYAIRTFPIWDGELFHGGTSCHLSGSWALAEASRLRNDEAGMQLVGKQLEWTFGRNPFDQTLMYGVGYNFTPQFAYCTKNIVGSLPVGMDCMKNDEPYWHGSAYATSKEMWIAPVNRFMGTVAAYMEAEAPDNKTITMRIEKEASKESTQKAVLVLKGKGAHQLDIRLFNATTDFVSQQVSLTEGEELRLEMNLQIQDVNKPYVAVVVADGNTLTIAEVNGACF